jgi:hypothetical protein
MRRLLNHHRSFGHSSTPATADARVYSSSDHFRIWSRARTQASDAMVHNPVIGRPNAGTSNNPAPDGRAGGVAARRHIRRIDGSTRVHNGRRRFTYSRLMWVALDHAIRIAVRRALPAALRAERERQNDIPSRLTWAATSWWMAARNGARVVTFSGGGDQDARADQDRADYCLDDAADAW